MCMARKDGIDKARKEILKIGNDKRVPMRQVYDLYKGDLKPADVFNAATLGGCRFIERDDLGRLAPGARADILVIDLDRLGSLVYHDPIKALIDAGSGRDIDTVIVDGKTLVQGGRLTRVDEEAVYARAREAV